MPCKRRMHVDWSWGPFQQITTARTNGWLSLALSLSSFNARPRRRAEHLEGRQDRASTSRCLTSAWSRRGRHVWHNPGDGTAAAHPRSLDAERMANTRKRLREHAVASWNELRDVLEDLVGAGWAFRGQADVTWRLESSLTRYLRTFGGPVEEWPQREARSLRVFKRKAHLLLSRTPAEDETLDWLALMQHHGAPTRLLDFTYSPYVAAFFALERATTDAAIWAVFPNPKTPYRSARAISVLLNGRLGVPAATARGTQTRETVAVMGEPLLMNQRMTTQAGTFVIPVKRIDLPIESVLDQASVLKVKLKTGALRKQTMNRLYDMNMTNATLFPGVDGLARSLAFESEFRWTGDPDAARRLTRR